MKHDKSVLTKDSNDSLVVQVNNNDFKTERVG